MNDFNVRELRNELYVEAQSYDEAVETYLNAVFENIADWIVDEIVCNDFIDLLEGWDIEMYEVYSQDPEAMELAFYIYDKYDLYNNNCQNIDIEEKDREKIISTIKDKRAAYRIVMEYEVVARELITTEAFVERAKNNKKNIIEDINEYDIYILNYISHILSQNPDLDDITITQESFKPTNLFNSFEELKTYILNELHTVVSIDHPNGFTAYSLIWSMHGCPNELKIKPAEIMIKLALADYDYSQGKNQKAIQILRENSHIG